MKKFLFVIYVLLLFPNLANAKTDLKTPENILQKKDITVLTKGETINYPLANESIIECYAKKIDGSIDEFEEYNDYFVVRNNRLYSNTMHKLYKPNRINKLKKVDRAKLLNGKITLKLYDPLWEASIRRHKRTIKINTKTGAYYMKGMQDNWMWYRNVVTSGYCRVIK